MMHKAKYRLGEYLITEFETGLLQWETHAALGMQRSGRCFILDNILIIGPCRDEDIGYLKLEFHEQLEKLPVWHKTRYYCFAFDLLNVINGQILKEDFLQRIMTLTQIKRTATNSITDIKHGTFRLGRYQINVNENGKVSWQAIEGINKIIGGPCSIESNVLFLCPQEYVQENQNGHDVFNKLHQLPQWNNTIAWCRSMVLQNCQPQQQTKQRQAAVMRENIWNKFILNEKPYANYKKQHSE